MYNRRIKKFFFLKLIYITFNLINMMMKMKGTMNSYYRYKHPYYYILQHNINHNFFPLFYFFLFYLQYYS